MYLVYDVESHDVDSIHPDLEEAIEVAKTRAVEEQSSYLIYETKCLFKVYPTVLVEEYDG